MSTFCKLDVRKAVISKVLKETIDKAIIKNIEGRYSYKLVDDNYTIEIVPNKKIVSNYAAREVATSLKKIINSYSPNILRVVSKNIDEHSPIQLEVYVNPDFIEKKFQELPQDKRNNVPVSFERDLEFFNGDQALYEQEEKDYQKLTQEEKAKTIEQVTKEHRSITALKDLSAKLAHRIGGKVKFVNKTDADWKGYNQGMTSVLNEAYMDESTAFHEIAFHPIIRALKSMSSQKESVTLQQMIDNQEIEKKCN